MLKGSWKTDSLISDSDQNYGASILFSTELEWKDATQWVRIRPGGLQIGYQTSSKILESGLTSSRLSLAGSWNNSSNSITNP
jgi:hypothetical protein